VLPHDVVGRTCSRADVEDALGEGSVIEVEWRGAPALALVDVGESEELLADGLRALAEENRLAVVVGPDPEGRRTTLARALGTGVPSVALDEAHAIGLDEALAAVEDLPEQAVLALSLDNALPLGPVLGAVALDVAAAGVCPVLVADPAPDDRLLATARRAVAAGRWFRPSDTDRSCVVVPVATPDEAMLRVSQLVSTSIPRAFGHSGSAIGVLVLDGALDVDAVRQAVSAAAEAHALSGPLPRTWPAVVLVLPGVVTPALTRAQVYAGLHAGVEHVSVVHGFGDPAELAAALAATTDRPRRTRLAELLAT
jgi:hypothetical protein